MSALTYSNFLRLDELLSLQNEGAPDYEHDQMLFVVIHQVYELWFKAILFELDDLIKSLYANEQARSLHTLRRILTILKTCVSQIDILETMTPLGFLSFRDKLDAASGFQSFQFREVEFILGYKRRGIFANYEENSPQWQRLQARLEQPTLWDGLLHYLAQNGHAIPADQLERDVTQPVEASTAIQQALLDVYHSGGMDVRICERLVDLDEGIQEWRYRHVKMVERTIGSKKGTGGSSGVGYLSGTLFKPLFPDLWAIRAEL